MHKYNLWAKESRSGGYVIRQVRVSGSLTREFLIQGALSYKNTHQKVRCPIKNTPKKVRFPISCSSKTEEHNKNREKKGTHKGCPYIAHRENRILVISTIGEISINFHLSTFHLYPHLRLWHLDCFPVNTPPPAAPPLKQGRNWLSVRAEGSRGGVGCP